jgi:excinuclease ABC subunit C
MARRSPTADADGNDDPLRRKADALPQQPGVYLFKDGRGAVLYVGKARDLRARVRQYLMGQDERFMVRFLVHAARDVEVVVLPTEKDALILENTLIKKHQPRYNTKLIDDSAFLHLRINPSGKWPRYDMVRKVDGTKARHFGPFHSASRARATLEFVHRRFPLRTCTDHELAQRKRPCLLHQMHRCLAPCVDLCTREEYDEVVDESILFLEGRSTELITRLGQRMRSSSAGERFEEAGRIRDLIRAIEASMQQQQVADVEQADRDIWGLARVGVAAMAAVIPVRKGLMQEAITLPLPEAVGDDGEVLSALLNTWYGDAAHIPPEVLLPSMPTDLVALTEVLAERRGRAVALKVPQRGAKERLIQVAEDNARSALTLDSTRTDRSHQALAELQRLLSLGAPPRRVECFDNSNIQGEDAVASMVVFTDGRPDRAAYRRYRVKTVVGADDFASMREILGRRFRRGLGFAEDGTALGPGDDLVGVFPDLLVVDGGKGQLGQAIAALADLGLHDQAVIGLAKPKTERRRGDRDAVDKVVLPGVKDPVRLNPNNPALLLLQHIRDESHKTAIGYHRKVREKRNLTSVLDELPGLGPARRKALLRHFGSLDGVKAASAVQIAEVPGFGVALAERVAAALAG